MEAFGFETQESLGYRCQPCRLDNGRGQRKAVGGSVPLRTAGVEPRPLVMVSVSIDDRVSPCRLRKIGKRITRSQNAEQYYIYKGSPDPEGPVIAAPKIPRKGHNPT